jgi:hypothetical protein
MVYLSLGISISHAVVREWTNPNSSIFDLSGNWTPSGIPDTSDTARFNTSFPSEVAVTFFSDEESNWLQVIEGSLKFCGMSTLLPSGLITDFEIEYDN